MTTLERILSLLPELTRDDLRHLRAVVSAKLARHTLSSERAAELGRRSAEARKVVQTFFENND